MSSLNWKKEDVKEAACAHGFIYTLAPDPSGMGIDVEVKSSEWRITHWTLSEDSAKAYCHLHASSVALAVKGALDLAKAAPIATVSETPATAAP